MDDFQNEVAEECGLTDVGCWTNWLMEAIANLFLWIFEQVLSGLASILEAITLPEWMTNIGNLQLPGDVLFWTTWLMVPEGVAIISSALGIRFLIRRLPFIG